MLVHFLQMSKKKKKAFENKPAVVCFSEHCLAASVFVFFTNVYLFIFLQAVYNGANAPKPVAMQPLYLNG